MWSRERDQAKRPREGTKGANGEDKEKISRLGTKGRDKGGGGGGGGVGGRRAKEGTSIGVFPLSPREGENRVRTPREETNGRPMEESKGGD